MSKVAVANRVPRNYDPQAIADLFRSLETQINLLSEGKVTATYNAHTAAPSGSAQPFQWGDFVKNTKPTEVSQTAIANYVVAGWVNTVAGSPGTWEECRFLTSDITTPPFESSREAQVSGVSQTVYTLTTISYTPGLGQLAVYIDGVRQHPSAYTETNSTTVTLSAAPATGVSVLFEVMGASLGTSSPTYGTVTVTDNIIISKTSGEGIKLDPATPTFGWRDIIGPVVPKATGAGSPTRRQYAGGNVYDWSFAENDVCDFGFHIPHDYVPGSDLHIHVHWSHNGTNITGNAVFTFYWQYAKGHNQANFHAEKSTTITYNTTDLATTPQYRHRIDEVAITASSGDSSHTLNTDIEVDGVIMGQLKLTTLPTITGGNLFIHTVDLHYQSTNLATKQKAPNFWT